MKIPAVICVCGAGTMGAGIAQTFARHGFPVVLYDLDISVAGAALARINSELEQLVAKNKLDGNEKADILSRITVTDRIEECRGDLVIEAVIENFETKTALIKQLFSLNGEDTIVVTNTSSLSVSSIASKAGEPSRFAGMHFFNPAPVMKLVEIVKTRYTGENVLQNLMAIAKMIGKTPVLCNDSPGFIVNRVARPYYLEALYLLEKESCDVESIDRLMENTGFKMGPFRLMDLIGNDINSSVTSIVYEALNKPERLKPSAIQQQKVQEGKLGRKTGKGYYEYSR